MAHFQKNAETLKNWKLKCIFFPWDVLSLGIFCLLGRFVPWDVLSLGHFVLGTFCPWDLMSEDVLSWDVLSLGTFCLGTFCLCTYSTVVCRYLNMIIDDLPTCSVADLDPHILSDRKGG